MPILLAAAGVLVISLDSSVNIAFPAIASAFGVGPTTVRWVIICYVLTYAVTAFLAGALADRVGPAPVFTAGLWLSVGCFLTYWVTPDFGAFLALRVAQGVGGGLVYGTAPALVTLSLPRERHGWGLGLMSLGLGVGLSGGPVIGGLLVDGFGWPAVFLFRVPLAGALALAAMWGLETTGRVGVAWRLVRWSDLLRWPVLSASALAFLANSAQFAVWLLVPFYLVAVLELSPSVGGFFFMLTPLGTATAAPLAGWATDRYGPRWLAAVGLSLEAGGLFAISRFTTDTPMPLAGAALALAGLGLGVFQAPNLAQLMAAFPLFQQGAAGGVAFLSRTLGIVVGVEVTASLFAPRLAPLGFAGAFAAAFVAAAGICAFAALLSLVPAAPSLDGPR